MTKTLTALVVMFILQLTGINGIVAQPSGNIELTITNIRNASGQVLVSVFNREQGFPSDSTQAFRTYIVEAREPKLTLNINNLPYGEYAIALVHDENRNLLLDYNLVGAPVEGYAATGSNRRFSAPRFQFSKFSLESRIMRIEVRMNYLF